MSRGDAIVGDKQGLVSPVGHKAEDESSDIKDRDCCGEAHHDPDHGDKNGETVLILDVGAEIHGFIFRLKQLLRLLLVAGASTIEATLDVAEEPEVHACDGDDAIDEGRGEDSDTNDLVPFRVKIDKVTIKEDVFKADLLKNPLYKAL